MKKKEMSFMEKYNRLQTIRNSLASNQPNIDELVPMFEETNEIENSLLSQLSNIKKVIADKRKTKEEGL
ncbi:hypothetical protein [Arcobacter sp.]|uniref:hypothetical protein n=1 Tax=Arcobacter sp. TaxID=1872629 RepID=UPI003D150171